MTAYISCRRHDRIELLTDCAYTNEATGALTHICGKVQGFPTLPHICGKVQGFPTLPMVITGAGTTSDLEDFYCNILRPSFREDFDDTIHELQKLSPRRRRPVSGHDYAVLIAGWSQTHGFRHFAMHTHPDHTSAPYHFIEIEDDLFIAGTIDDAEMEAARLDPEILLHDGLERRGPRFFQAFRKPVPSRIDPATEPFCGVGGQLQLTTLAPAAVDMRIIAYWPDWIGQRINPTRKFVPILNMPRNEVGLGSFPSGGRSG